MSAEDPVIAKNRSAAHTQRTVDLAVENVQQGGKPFACVVVDHDTGETVHEATNQVSQTNDVTAHAEINAIRELAAAGRGDLTGCDVYVTAYPCPMCLGALYYAAPEQVYYAASREQEGAHYEDGGRYMSLGSFYDEYAKSVSEQNLPSSQVIIDDPTASFRLWRSRHSD